MRVTSVCEHPAQDQCIVLVWLQFSMRFDRDIFPLAQEGQGRTGWYSSPHIWVENHVLCLFAPVYWVHDLHVHRFDGATPFGGLILDVGLIATGF
jgi:hypothetical protein